MRTEVKTKSKKNEEKKTEIQSQVHAGAFSYHTEVNDNQKLPGR